MSNPCFLLSVSKHPFRYICTPSFFSSRLTLFVLLFLACSFIVCFHFLLMYLFLSPLTFSVQRLQTQTAQTVILAAALICLLPETKPDQSRLINESLFTLSPAPRPVRFLIISKGSQRLFFPYKIELNVNKRRPHSAGKAAHIR